MNIPFFITLIIYAILMLSILSLGIFNIWHMIRFGMFDFSGKLNTGIFIGFTVLILLATGLLLYSVPWADTFTIGEIINFSFGSQTETISL